MRNLKPRCMQNLYLSGSFNLQYYRWMPNMLVFTLLSEEVFAYIVITLNKSPITNHSFEFEEFSFCVCFEECFLKMEIFRVLFMVKDRFKQWRHIMFGSLSKNKDNPYLVCRKCISWKMLWMNESQNMHSPM